MSRPHNFKEEAKRMLAQMQGEITYQSSSPCRFGHLERYVKSRSCVECQIEHSSREYQGRKMGIRAMNKERVSNGELLQGMK